MSDLVGGFDEIWSRAKTDISEHWSSCEESGLEHTVSNRDEILIALERYVTRLKSAPTDDSAVIEAIRAFYAELNLTNEKYDFGLLETDERELLVPIIVELAQTAGVNPDDYDGEPGGEYRDF